MIAWVKRELLATGTLTRDEVEKCETAWLASPINGRPWFSDFVLAEHPRPPVRHAVEDAHKRAGVLLRTANLDLILNEVREQKAILFIGAGFSIADSELSGGDLPLTGATVKEALLETLPPELSDAAGFRALSMEEIAEHFDRLYGRDLLNGRLRALCSSHLPRAPLPHHHTLASLSCFRFLVTTNWDRLIESASAQHGPGNGLHVISRGEQIRDLELHRSTLLKVHGDFDQSQSIWVTPPRVTSTDLRNLEFDEPAVFSLLQALVLTHRIVVVGFHPSDYTLNRLLQHAMLATRTASRPVRPIVVVDPNGAAHLSARFHTPVPVLTTADLFLDLVKTFVDNDGHAVGHGFRGRVGGKSPQHVWARRQCDLAGEVLEQFPALRRVEVIRSSLAPSAPNDVQTVVARRAGIIVQESLPAKNGRLAISCGTTLRRLIELLDPTRKAFDKLTITSTSIPLSDISDATSPFSLVTQMATRLGGRSIVGRAYQFPAGFADHVIAEEWLRLFPNIECPIGVDVGEGTASLAAARKVVEEHLREAATAQVFCLGVGSMLDHTTALGGYGLACLEACRVDADSWVTMADDDRKELVGRYFSKIADKKRVIGEILYRFFREPDERGEMFLDDRSEVQECLREFGENPAGRFVEFVLRLFHHVITIDVEKIREAAQDPQRTVMLVAAKRHKAQAVRALLSGGYANTVVVDQELAHALVNDRWSRHGRVGAQG